MRPSRNAPPSWSTMRTYRAINPNTKRGKRIGCSSTDWPNRRTSGSRSCAQTEATWQRPQNGHAGITETACWRSGPIDRRVESLRGASAHCAVPNGGTLHDGSQYQEPLFESGITQRERHEIFNTDRRLKPRVSRIIATEPT
jgi:hypothetical protein